MSRITSTQVGEKRTERMGGLIKGLAVMEGFSPSRPKMTITQAAELADISPASARRCLLALRDAGYVLQEGYFFRPTPRMVRLSAGYTGTSGLDVHAQPLLEEAREALGESVSLAVLDDNECLFIARASASHVVSTGISVGARLPAHASATGRVLLAAREDDAVRHFFELHPPVKRTPSTIIDVEALLQTIKEVKQTGYAVSSEELELGMHSLAVPVSDSRGNCVGAISVSAFTGRLTLQELAAKAVPILREAAGQLGRSL